MKDNELFRHGKPMIKAGLQLLFFNRTSWSLHFKLQTDLILRVLDEPGWHCPKVILHKSSTTLLVVLALLSSDQVINLPF